MRLLASALVASVCAQPYKDPTLPVADRVADLLSRMTVVEMMAQLINRADTNSSWLLSQYGSTSMGSIFIDVVASESWTNASAWDKPLTILQKRNALQQAFLNTSRLGIPISVCAENLHSGAWGGTIFPGLPTQASTFNESLIQAIGAAIAYEARGEGIDTALSPVVNMFTDYRFGRFQEGYAPDPAITSRLARQQVLGLQGGYAANDSQSSYLSSFNMSMIAQAKHAAGYGAALGGLNGGVAEVTNRTFMEVYARPWRAMAGAGLRSLMVSHQTANGVPCHANRWLLSDLMRGQFGMVNTTFISDEDNIGHLGPWGWAVADNFTHVASVALAAGIDLDLEGGQDPTFLGFTHLPDAHAEGLVTQEQIAAATSRVLTMKFAAGLFDAPITPESYIARLNTSTQLAYEAAAQGVVLVKNDGDALPVDFTQPGLKVAMIGQLMSCNFSTPWSDAYAATAVGARRSVRRAYGTWALPGGKRRGLPTTGHLGDPTPHLCTARDSMLGAYALDSGVVEVPLLPDALLARFPAISSSMTISQGCGMDPGNEHYELIAPAVAAATASDVIIVTLGDTLNTCNEGVDRDSLDLPGGQLELLAALIGNKTKGQKLIGVFIGGRPATFGPNNVYLQGLDALLVTYRPGQMGGLAIVDVLSGAVVPTGKLTHSWISGVGQVNGAAAPWLGLINGEWRSNGGLPQDSDGRVYPGYLERPSTPVYPLGWGLSYTTYSYTSLSVAVKRTSADPACAGPISGLTALRQAADPSNPVLVASVGVCNTGSVAGTETILVFVRDPRGGFSRTVRYWKRLVGFGRLPLAAGACGSLDIPITLDDLALYDDGQSPTGPYMQLRLLPGQYIITAGPHSRADSLNQTATL